MTGKRVARACGAACLALALVFSQPVSSSPAAAASLTEMQSEQASLKAKQKEIDAKLAQLKSDKAKQQEYVESLNTKVSNTEEQISNLDSQISAMDADIVKKQEAISGKQKEIDENFQKLRQRVYALYLTGEASNLEIVLNAKNIMDLADKTELLQVITKHDTSLINTIKADMNSIKAQKEEIEKSRSDVAAKRTEADSRRRELVAQQSEASAALAKLSATEQAELQAKQENTAAQKETDAAIDQWFADYYAEQKRKQAEEEAAKKKQQEEQQQQNNSSSSSGGSSDSGDSGGGSSGGSEVTGTGSFIWPVPSYISISQYYGSYDMGSFHKGIDIAAAYGSPIVASDAGTVIASVRQDYHGIYGGYGNVVVIDHGSGYTTLYAHMSSRAVSEGDSVSSGQVIGYVGSTGQSTGNHCHFEIRKYGVVTNPMSYFG